jgi:hypothetical protein
MLLGRMMGVLSAVGVRERVTDWVTRRRLITEGFLRSR